MSSTQQITGLASGFDTASIVEQLMKIEKIPYDKLDVKKQTQQLKLQAYQAVNSMLLKFRTSVSNLSSQKLWQSKSATSTNESSVTATANEYAVKGSYSLRVAQLATAAQFMSKGFASSKTALVKQPEGEDPYKLGTISVNNSKSRVDTSAKLSDLNGGAGVYRGSIRVTDASNNTSIIDLSTADTIDDVVTLINNSSGAQISASLVDGKLRIDDESGGTGKMKILNVGTGRTASDLGIAGTAETAGGAIVGRSVFYMGNDTGLSLLQDGLGVEEGKIGLNISYGADSVQVAVDLQNLHTVGDVVTQVNAAIAAKAKELQAAGNGNWELVDGLQFGINADRNGFSLSGTKAGASYEFYNNVGEYDLIQSQTANQLGLTGMKSVAADGEILSFARVLGDANSPMLKNLSGVTGYGVGQTTAGSMVPIALNWATPVSALNGGTGVNTSMPFQLRLYEGGNGVNNGENYREFLDILDPAELNQFLAEQVEYSPGQFREKNLGELVQFMNDKLAAYAADPANNAASLTGMKFEIYEAGAGLVITGASAAHKFEIAGSLAGSLGLTRADSLGTPLVTSDQSVIDAMTAFYEPTQLIHDNQFMDANTKLEDLNLTAAQLAMFTSPSAGDFVMTIDGTSYDLSADIAAAGFTNDMKVNDFVAALNTIIRDNVGGSSPQIAVDPMAMGFAWWNMDFSKSFDAAGGLAAEMGVDKSIAPVAALSADYLPVSLNPMASGYVTQVDFNASNADQIRLSSLNSGNPLTFAGDGALDFDLGSGGAFSLTMDEIRAATGGSLNTDLATYVANLNALIAQKLTDIGSSATLELAVGQNGIHITNLSGLDKLVVSGGVAGDPAVTGLGTVDIAAIDPADIPGTVALSSLRSATFTVQDVEGIGSVKIQVEGQPSPIYLDTNGITQDSTLQELMKKLNEGLAANGLADMAFVVNSAGTGLAFENQSSNRVAFLSDNDNNRLAEDLGFVKTNADGQKIGVTVDSYSLHNAGSLSRNYVGRATSIASLAGGDGVVMGNLSITDATGKNYTFDMAEAKTVGDVMDAINSVLDMGVKAVLNERGDGITLVEGYHPGYVPGYQTTGEISVADSDGGTLAKVLGIAGTGSRDNALGVSIIEGSQKTVIDVMSSDTLESLMYRISEQGGYKTAIINDGSATNPYRLTISSTSTGEASDFIIESDLDIFGFNQTSRGKDSKVLYGDPNSGSSPVMLSSATNSNSNAILGLTLDLKAVSDAYTTITVDTDKSKVVEEIQNMVQTYNDLNDLVSYLDAYDPESGEPGILFGDNSIRSLMEEINDMFYRIYNPDQLSYSEAQAKAKATGHQATWTWMDIGLSLTAKNSNSDGSGQWYSSMDLDLDAMNEMVASNWDVLFEMLAGQRNAANSNLSDTVKASAGFNGKAAEGFKVENAINGDSSSSTWGAANGFMAEDTIASGANEYTIYFQKPTTMSRMSVYFMDSATSLQDYTIEYMDANTGKWETLREVKSNSQASSHFGMAAPTTVSAIRITAATTNAADGKFRLLDVQVFEETGLAGQLNQLTTQLGDVSNGWLAERDSEVNSDIADIEEQMTRLQEKMDSKEASLWKRFTAMETALSQLQNQSNYFSSMMSSLTANNSKK